MKKKIIAIIAVVAVIVIIGVVMCLKSGASRFASAEKIDLDSVTKECVSVNAKFTKITTQYVGKEVKVDGKFERLKIISPLEAKLLGLEGNNLWCVNVIHKTKVQHSIHSWTGKDKTEDTPVNIACYVTEEQGKKIQKEKNIGDDIELCGVFVEVMPGSRNSYVNLVLKDGVAR